MADVEDALVEPTGNITTAPLTSSEVVIDADGSQKRVTSMVSANAGTALTTVGSVILQKANVATNAAATPPATTKNIPPLVEQQLDSYVAGKRATIVVITIGAEYVEKFTGYDFLLMQKAARKDGIRLLIGNGFRTFEVQARLFAERVNPDGTLTPAGEKLGRAARPGFSNHQSGTALDLRVKMTIDQLKAKEFSAEYLWLKENGARFGFDNDEVPSEPWHWRHKEKRIVGPTTDEDDYLLSLVSAQASGAAAVQSGKVDASLFLDKTLHDTTKAHERSVAMSRTDRQLLYANMGREAVFRGASLIGKASRYQQRLTTAVIQQPEYVENSLKTVTFDFETGTWGDGGSV